MQHEEGEMALLKKKIQPVGKTESFLSLYGQSSVSIGKTFILSYTNLLPIIRDNMLLYLGACEISAYKLLEHVVTEQCSLLPSTDDNYTM